MLKDKDYKKKLEEDLKDAKDELKLIEFERSIGIEMARRRKIKELNRREQEANQAIEQIDNLLMEENENYGGK